MMSKEVEIASTKAEWATGAQDSVDGGAGMAARSEKEISEAPQCRSIAMS
jgi:hypothetical protein